MKNFLSKNVQNPLSVCTLIMLYNTMWTTYLHISRPRFDTTLSTERKLFILERMIESFRKGGQMCKNERYYCKRPETAHVDCGRVLRGDKTYLETLSGKYRIPLIPNEQLNMSCEAISERVVPKNAKFKPLKLNGTAFARVVYVEYEFIEKQVQAAYHYQNWFCFAVDRNSSIEFQKKMKQLAEGLPNVILLPVTESYDEDGHNINSAHYRCMMELVTRPGWSYLVLLQNFDLITKSVYEMDRIFELLDGANDVNLASKRPGRRKPNLKWDLKTLKLFRNKTIINKTILNSEIEISTGYVQASLSRAAAQWLINDVDVTTFMNQLNQSAKACDEQFISTFQINEALKMPGHFTSQCIRRGISLPSFTRFSRWVLPDQNTRENCSTQAVRHNLCLFGIEDFRTLSEMPVLLFNKVIPGFDYSIVDCTAELMYNRTFLGQVDHELREDFYRNLVNVQFHKNHNTPGYILNCTSDFEALNYY